MTCIIAVKADGIVALAADHQATRGDGTISHVMPGDSKIVTAHGGAIAMAVCGAQAARHALAAYAAEHAPPAELTSAAVFAWNCGLRAHLKSLGFESDDSSKWSAHMSASGVEMLLCSRDRIFNVSERGDVIEISTVLGTGSGGRFSMGAAAILLSAQEWTAGRVASRAVGVACAFDDGCSLRAGDPPDVWVTP